MGWLWNQVKLETPYRFFIILDGLDEMSLDMSDLSVLDNLIRLEHLLPQFNGCKVLVTSRKMDGHTDCVRERVLEALHQPLVLHMAPVTLEDRLTFLERMANTPERRARLEKIRATHDLIGLAAKPLFLHMIEAQLDNKKIHAMDMVDIYQDYAEQTLARSYEYHLELERNHTSPRTVRSRMLLMLERLALCMQELGTDRISLEEFKTIIGQEDLAQEFWDRVGPSSQQVSEDADRRFTGRTLLKCDNMEPEKRCFFHRSMKEFFVACGIVHTLCQTDGDEARSLLSQRRLSHEILGFAGQQLRRLDGGQRDFEKSGQLASFAVCPTEDILLAHYRDGVIRGWPISHGTSQAMAELEQTGSYPGRILSSRGGREGLLCSDQFQFWVRSADRIVPDGHAVLRPGLQILDFGETVVLAQQDSLLYLISLADKSILYQRETSAEAKACLMTDRVLILQADGADLELVDLSDKSPVSTIYPHLRQISCLCASARSDSIIILSGDEQGNVKRFYVSLNRTTGQWDFASEGAIFGCEKPVRTIALDAAGRLYAAASTGAIIRYSSSGTEQVKADAVYHLERYNSFQSTANAGKNQVRHSSPGFRLPIPSPPSADSPKRPPPVRSHAAVPRRILADKMDRN